MTLFDMLFAYGMTLAIGLLMMFMPALSRRTTFFAVTVPEDFPDSEEGRAIHRRYLGITAIATLAPLALITPAGWWLSRDIALGLAYGIAPLLPVLGGLAAFVHCRGIAMEYRSEGSAERRASLQRDRLVDIVPGRWWMHVGPYLLLAAAMGWLALQWDQLPDQGPDRVGTEEHGFRAAPRAQQAVGKDVAAIRVRAQLDLVHG